MRSAAPGEGAQVLVAGGGPAGSAAALTLARLGRRVVLVDDGHRAVRAGAPVGECLPPAARPLLRDLGLLDAVRRGGHLPCVGNVSVWGSAAARTHDFLFDPQGPGWHLDRARFDHDLRLAAAQAGAVVVRGARVAHVSPGEGAWSAAGGWRVRLRQEDGPSREVRATWLVDATGRPASVARGRGAVMRRQDRLVAFVARLRASGSPATDADARTWIEAAPDGWWYTAPLPSGERSVVYHTDADLADRTALVTAAGFGERLRQAPRTATRLAAHGWRLQGRPRGADAGTLLLDPAHGPGWLAVGDAALSFDPLSSQGLFHALYTGLRGGQAVHSALEGDGGGAALAYGERLREVHRAYLLQRATWYAAETRWPDRPFWRRRRGAGADDAGPGSLKRRRDLSLTFGSARP